MHERARVESKEQLQQRIQIARGRKPAETVIRGAQYLDVFSGTWCTGDVALADGIIVGTQQDYEGNTVVDGSGCYLVPGFIDAHVHIESSMMTPARFQEMVLPRGTTTVVWDPHEIANVRGTRGIEWALQASEGLELDVYVMVPSCVPSTSPEFGLETSGAVINAEQTAAFQSHPRVLGLAEMMNYPGVLGGQNEVMDKLVGFQDMKRDGHAPGLRGRDLNAYLVAGIHSCHESTQLAEAQEKLQKGLHVLIREGSCAKDGDALLPLLNAYTSAVLGVCSDDRNPADIMHEGHLEFLINKALRLGSAPQDVFRMVSWSAARIFGLGDRGAVAPGFKGDLVLVRPEKSDDWRQGVRIERVFKSGNAVDGAQLQRVADEAARREGAVREKNIFLEPIDASLLEVTSQKQGQTTVRVIRIHPGSIVTGHETAALAVRQGQIVADPKADVLKIAVIERHHGTGRCGVGFVRGFALQRGAIATSINHDSHNVIVVGADEAAMVRAVNRLITIDGGIVVTDGQWDEELPLEIGGLMSAAPVRGVAEQLTKLKDFTRQLGCALPEPFLGLSFLALPVIPQLKITDRGLVDVEQYSKVAVEVS